MGTITQLFDRAEELLEEREVHEALTGMAAVMAARNSDGEADADGEVDASIAQSDAAVANQRAAKRQRDIEAQFPSSLAALQATAALHNGAMHACLIDAWCGNHEPPSHEMRIYPPHTQFLAADGVAALLEASSFSVARHFSREQIGSTCGHVAVGFISQCADQLAQGKAVSDLSFDEEDATCMRRIIKTSRALGESKALARNATDAPFLNNLEMEALVGSADVQEKVAAARSASAACTPSCQVQVDDPMNGFAFVTHVTRLLQRRLQSGSEEATVRVLIVNDSYGGKGIHWWTAVVYF